MAERGQPKAIRCDNGPELTSRHFLAWCVERQIELVRIQPGKPTQKRARGEFPPTVAGRVFDRELVSELVRCAAEDRGVEDRVQRGAPAQQFGLPHAERVCGGAGSELLPVMSFQAFRNLIARGELIGSVVLVVIGIAFIALAPAKQPVERASMPACFAYLDGPAGGRVPG